MEHDKFKLCNQIIDGMWIHIDTQINGVNMFIQLEQATQLKRIADALEVANNEVDRKARSIGRCGPM
jgi:hypothetical protein